MAGVSFSPRVKVPLLSHPTKIVHGIRCCSKPPENNNRRRETPEILKVAVSGVTELLRVVSSFNRTTRFDEESDKERDEFLVRGIDDVVMILEADYKNAYFVTGIFASVIYAEDCIFEDPTIRFQGTELYSRNLNLLIPFFDSPSIGLDKIEKRTYLKLPWRPLISIDGSTVYELDDKFKASIKEHYVTCTGTSSSWPDIQIYWEVEGLKLVYLNKHNKLEVLACNPCYLRSCISAKCSSPGKQVCDLASVAVQIFEASSLGLNAAWHIPSTYLFS